MLGSGGFFKRRHAGTESAIDHWLDVLRENNAAILNQLQAKAKAEADPWSAEDWRAFYDERAAICEFDGGLTRGEAEDLAAQCQGYDNVGAFRAANKTI